MKIQKFKNIKSKGRDPQRSLVYVTFKISFINIQKSLAFRINLSNNKDAKQRNPQNHARLVEGIPR